MSKRSVIFVFKIGRILLYNFVGERIYFSYLEMIRYMWLVVIKGNLYI